MDELITKVSPVGFQLNKFDVQKGEISAVVTSFNNLDVVQDRIMPGALDDYISSFKPGLKMLYMHSRTEPIGQWDKLTVKGDLVVGDGIIYPEVTRGKDVMSLIARGQIGATSIGFIPNEYKFNDEGGRDFEKISLMEISMVDTPANPKAQLLATKAREGDFDIKEFQAFLRQAGMSRKQTSDVFNELKNYLRQADNEGANVAKFKRLLKR